VSEVEKFSGCSSQFHSLLLSDMKDVHPVEEVPIIGKRLLQQWFACMLTIYALHASQLLTSLRQCSQQHIASLRIVSGIRGGGGS
jgi:hypothetical protein